MLDISEENIWVVRPTGKKETYFSWCRFFQKFEWWWSEQLENHVSALPEHFNFNKHC